MLAYKDFRPLYKTESNLRGKKLKDMNTKYCKPRRMITALITSIIIYIPIDIYYI